MSVWNIGRSRDIIKAHHSGSVIRDRDMIHTSENTAARTLTRPGRSEPIDRMIVYFFVGESPTFVTGK